MALSWPNKDPDEVLDYTLNWTARVKGDPIVASEWIVPETITKDSDTFDGKSTTIWLSGGTIAPVPLTITNRVSTNAGRVMEQSVLIKIASK